MNTPARHTSPRPSAATSTAAAQRRERTGTGSTAQQAFLRLQSRAGNRAAAAAVQRARAAAPEAVETSPQAPALLPEMDIEDGWAEEVLERLESTRQQVAETEASARQAAAAAGERAGPTADAVAADEHADAWAGQVVADTDAWAEQMVAGTDRGAESVAPEGRGEREPAGAERNQRAAGSDSDSASARQIPSGTRSESVPQTPVVSRPASAPRTESVPQTPTQSTSAPQTTAGTRTATPQQEQSRPQPATGAAARTKPKKRERAVQYLERLKKLLDLGDNPAKGAQSPTASGLHSQAGTSSGGAADSGLTQQAAAVGASAGSANLVTEVLGIVVNALDSIKNLKTAEQKKSGAAHHTARRKGRTKRTDAVVGAVSASSYAGVVGREASRAQQAAHAATSAGVAGGFSAASGAVKAVRAGYKVTHSVRKYRDIKKVEDRTEERLTQLKQEVERAERESGNADAAKAAYEKAQQDAGELRQAQKYAKKKQFRKGVKETLGGVGEGAKSAGGIVVVTIAVGTMASNPAGWATAAAGAGLILLVAGYKAVKAGTKRYQEARHPDDYTPDGRTAVEAKSWQEALGHAFAFWKKVSRHERQLMAHKIYRMAAGPDVPGSEDIADGIRTSARELLIALRAGPKEHKLAEDKWKESLNDPQGKSAWIKEITEQLASG